MSNKGMLTSKYNRRIVSTSETTNTSCSNDNYNFSSNWFVTCHNKPKASDCKNWNYTNKSKARCRRIGSIWIEPESDNWHLSEIEIEQQKLYNKLLREYKKEISQDISDINKRVREAEDTTVKVFNRTTLKGGFAFHQHSNIIKMAIS